MKIPEGTSHSQKKTQTSEGLFMHSQKTDEKTDHLNRVHV